MPLPLVTQDQNVNRPRVVGPRPASPPAGGGSNPGAGPYFNNNPGAEPPRTDNVTTSGGPGHGSTGPVGNSTNNPQNTGATPFWNSPGVQVAGMQGYNPGQQFASQRVTGETISNDPWVSAALSNFSQNALPEIQNRSNLMGLGRSTAALNAESNAKMQALLPLYTQAANMEQERINRMTAQGNTEAGLSRNDIDRLYGGVESELGRRERSSERVSNANQNMIANLMGLQGNLMGRQQQVGQGLFNMGGTFRDYAQQGNQAEQQDFLRRQALGEQAVYAPFGGLAQGGLGSTTSSSGK